MGRAEAEAALLGEWRARYPVGAAFCPDGMVDAVEYDASPIRVLVVLRETNVTPGSKGQVAGFDVREFLRTGKLERTYSTVARWAWAAVGGFPPVAQVNGLPRDVRVRLIRSIAIINLKKLAGRASANVEVVSAVAHQDDDLLHRQVALLDPDVVIAGGTWEHSAALCGHPVVAPVELPQAAVVGDRLLLGFHHPSARGRTRWQQDYEHLTADAAVRQWMATRGVTPAS